MVFFFHPRGYVEGKDDFLIYMGKDKYENEELIKYGLPTDVWFHVDALSGCKQNDLKIVYTPWSNLKKTPSMDVGQVGFFDEKCRRYVTVASKQSTILNRLDKTKQERQPNLKSEKEAYEALQRGKKRAEERAARAAEKAEKEATKQQEELKSYKSLMRSENMTSNAEMRSKYQSFEEAEDDFM